MTRPRRQCWLPGVVRYCVLVLAVCLEGELQAAASLQVGRVLDPALTAELAERFAPVFVFHPDEQYFPSSPLFPLAGTVSPSRSASIAALGTTDSRVADYVGLTPEEKSAISILYYRAYPSTYDGDDVVVLEYWLYYVQNDYRVRGNILPFWFDSSHPNDLEHVHVVLHRVSGTQDPAQIASDGAGAGFAMVAIYASAHEGNIPANWYRYVSDTPRRPRILVELGSHAMAPDIDEDGRFTPETDGDSGYKMLWGIRDRGITWFPYSSSYMEARVDGEAPVLVPSVEPGQLPQIGLSYRLAPVEALSADFERVALTDAERRHAFEKDVHWFRRVFGGDNGSSDRLLVPPKPVTDGDSVGIADLSSSERGVLVGTSLSVEAPGLFLGGRYSFLHGSKYLPDVVLEADGVLTKDNAYLVSQFMLSYPIDGSTRVMGGRELVTDSITFKRRQWNWMVAAEVKLGHMRIQGSFRSVGPLSGVTKEFRVSRFF